MGNQTLTTEARPSHEEMQRIADEVFRRDVEPILTEEDKGKYLLIDVYSGDYEIDADQVTAYNRLKERRPNLFVWYRRTDSPFIRRRSALRRSRQ
jgi:hypothetical protein